MACSSSSIPRCAVELLFAEDLIHRIMSRHMDGQFKAWRAAPYREFIFNAFNEDIGKAVDFIDTILEWELDETFSKMVDEHRVDRESFINYALHFEELSFKQGFDADNFLNFCARLVCLAAYFAQYGQPLALELALFFIMKVMIKYDLFEGGWDTLNAVAKKYLERKEDFCNVLTPDVSDDESSMNDEEEDEYILLNEDGGFAIDEVDKPKDELDRQRLDGSRLHSSDGDEDEGFILNVDDESAITQEEKVQNEPNREIMDLSGSKLYLPATSENEAEGYIPKGDYGSSITLAEKPQDKPDLERMDLSGSNLDLLAVSENVTRRYIPNGDYGSSIIQAEKPKDKPDCEKIDFSGSKLDLPACSESKGKIKISIPLDI